MQQIFVDTKTLTEVKAIIVLGCCRGELTLFRDKYKNKNVWDFNGAETSSTDKILDKHTKNSLKNNTEESLP